MTEQTAQPRRGRWLLVVAGALALAGLIALLVVMLVPLLTAAPAAVSASSPRPTPVREQGARFVAKGECVAIEGTEQDPLLRVVSCGPGRYLVLQRVDGTVDAETACSGVHGYAYNYTYDSALDSLDFVLCLKQE